MGLAMVQPETAEYFRKDHYSSIRYENNIICYLVNGFPLKSATWRVLQYEILSGISIISE